MCGGVVGCTLVCLLTLDTLLLYAAPVSSPDHDNKLSIYLNNIAEDMKSQESPLLRRKRHIVTSDDVALAAIAEAENFEADMASSEPHSRRRRSAAFFLHAAMKLCEGHPAICKRIELSDHGLKVAITVSEA